MVSKSKRSRGEAARVAERGSRPAGRFGQALASGTQDEMQSCGGWVPATKNAKVDGRDIGGMVYVGTPPQVNKFKKKCSAYIDPSLPVDARGLGAGDHRVPFWVGYSEINPPLRATYLDWLADGRSDPKYGAGFALMYFQGLERRYFVDDSSEDEKRAIFDEAIRIMDMHSDNSSLQHNIQKFISAVTISTIDHDGIEPVFENVDFELPLPICIAIGARLGKGERISADWALSWFMCHPESVMPKKQLDRCLEQFKALFRIRFDERFPEGLEIARPERNLEAKYSSVSGEFEVPILIRIDGEPVADIAGTREPVWTFQEIADGAMSELDAYGRFVGSKPEARGSVKAHVLLPMELQSLFPCEEVEELGKWASESASGDGIIYLDELIEGVEGVDIVRMPPKSVGIKRLQVAAEALARAGYGFVPDPRFDLRMPSWDDPLLLFKLGKGSDLPDRFFQGYPYSLLGVAIGCYLADSDGGVPQTHRGSLKGWLGSAAKLDDRIARRLMANLKLFFDSPPKPPFLRRYLRKLDEEGKFAVRAATVRAAQSLGILTSKELDRMSQIYRAMGFDPQLVNSDLHPGGLDDVLRKVRAGRPAPSGEAIPPEDTAESGLDASRIEYIRTETARASSMLGRIFDADEGQDETAVEETASALPGLDGKQIALVGELVTRERWTDEDFGRLCEKRGLLAAGALEAVNEWAFDVFGAALLDESDGYEIAPEVADGVRGMFEGARSGLVVENESESGMNRS